MVLNCNETDPNEDLYLVQPCFMSQDFNYINLCFRKVVTQLTGIWRAENTSTLSLPSFITQLFVILCVNRVLTLAVRPLHIPRIAAEILGGILLGPSGIGFTDFVVNHITPFGTIMTLENIAALGIIYFMFMVGLEVDLNPVLTAGRKAVTTAVAGIILPVPLGYALHHLLLENFAEISKNQPSQFGPLFWGLAIATTNFPDLAGLLADLKLLHTDVGRTALTSSVISDIICWFLFILVMATSSRGRIFTVTTTSVFVMFSLFALRPAIKYLVRRYVKDENYTQRHVMYVMAGVVLCAYVTDACGSHSIFGAFMFGVILPKGELKRTVMEMVEDFVSELLIPLFFYCIGLRTDVHWIFRRGVGLGMLSLVIFLAFSAKVVSTFIVAYFLNKMKAKDSLALGLLLNTKGLLALIIISTGRDMLALDMQTFTVLVFALLIMTAVVGPILSSTYSRKRTPGQYKYRTIRSIGGNSEFRILACVHSTRNAGGLVNLLASSNPTKQSPVYTFVVHLVELVGHASAMLIVHDTCKTTDNIPGAAATVKDPRSADGIAEAFDSLEGENFSVQPLTAVSAYSTMHEDICSLAEDKRVTLTILPFHVHSTAEGGGADSSANSPFRAVNKNVLDNTPCSAAVFFDRGFNTRPSLDESNSGFRHQFAMIFLGGRDDREALAYAWRMAKSPRVCLTVYRFIPSKTVAEISPTFADDDGDDDKEGGILNAIVDNEKEKPLDEQYIEEFKLKSRDDHSIMLIEEVVDNGEEVVRIVSTTEKHYDLYVVGRGRGAVSPLTSGLSDWSEYPELGPLGDILVCSSFAAEASVLVVQQGVGLVDEQEGVGQVREEFGHMTWHPPEMNNSSFAPFIHRRVRVTDDDDHL
ncbi:cation/H(+) antiporter 15-like [Humulus lupulus]|uniref:cation/H(+) antiporter 15-like n=1 Tax=Humulus lupulus TaxID=3486 RepID=UPI002B407FFB|nr:cation/H(+) antiporter 15-like [Humulus lupulus]